MGGTAPKLVPSAGFNLVGNYTFSSLANFLAGRYMQYAQGFGETQNNRLHQYFSAYVQGSWAPGTRLTMNYGVRYDFEVQPKSPTGQRLGSDWNNLRPRFGLAYDLTDRNAFRGPGMSQLDLRVRRIVPLGSRKLSLYLEGFNLLNRVNVQSLNTDYGANPLKPEGCPDGAAHVIRAAACALSWAGDSPSDYDMWSVRRRRGRRPAQIQ